VNQTVGNVAGPSAKHIWSIQSAVRRYAQSNSLLFRGDEVTPPANEYISTRSEQAIRGSWSQKLAVDRNLTLADAEIVAADIINELEDPARFRLAVHSMPSMPLCGSIGPMWIADPTSSNQLPEVNLSALRLRLGIEARPTKQVLLRIASTSCWIPRFADSGGYPYWRPGGRTEPTEDCPAGLDGFDEYVVEAKVISDLTGPFLRYQSL